MAAMSYYLAQRSLGNSVSSDVYVALTTLPVNPYDDGHSIYEPTAGQYTNYQRVQITPGNWNALTSLDGITTLSNADNIIFATLANTSSGVRVVGYAITDSPVVGNLLYYGTIAPTELNSDITPQLPPGTIKIQIQ